MEQAFAQPTLATRLPTPWLLPARILWLACSLIALVLFIAGLPLRAREIRGSYQGDIQAFLTQNQAGEVILSPGVSSAAARAGVLHGDVLLAADEVEIRSVE